MNYNRITDKMDITIDDSRKTILLQQKWKYIWTNDVGTTPWTYDEKKQFHDQLDRLIWGRWSSHFIVKTRGTSEFATNNLNSDFTVNFDVKWVLTGEHWTVSVKKIAPGKFVTSFVNWSRREISLDTEDVKQVSKGGPEDQTPVLHEFGHAIGYLVDEYKTTSVFNLDTYSVMNRGDTLRIRHIDYLIEELNKMIPKVTFYADRIV